MTVFWEQINISSFQGEECRRMAERLRKTYSDSDTPTLIEAAQYWREKQVAKATDLLQVGRVYMYHA